MELYPVLEWIYHLSKSKLNFKLKVPLKLTHMSIKLKLKNQQFNSSLNASFQADPRPKPTVRQQPLQQRRKFTRTSKGRPRRDFTWPGIRRISQQWQEWHTVAYSQEVFAALDAQRDWREGIHEAPGRTQRLSRKHRISRSNRCVELLRYLDCD